MATTIKQIAQRLGLDPSTVSRALSGSSQISEATRERVLLVAKELNYSPNLWAQSLVGNAHNLIGCLVLEYSNPFYPPMIRAIDDIAEQHDYIIFIGESRRRLEMEQKVIERFRRIRTAGVIIMPTMANLEHLHALEAEGVPVVIVGRTAPGFDCININNEKSGYLVGQRMTHQGHQRIGYIYSGDPNNTPELARLKGFQAALYKAGVKLERTYKVGNNKMDGGERAAERWLSESQRPTALFCSNDLLAMGFINLVTKQGMSVPDEVSVVGHDDIPFANLFKVALSTVAFPKYKMGQVAIQMLLERLNNPGNHYKPQYFVLEPEFIERCSCCPVF